MTAWALSRAERAARGAHLHFNNDVERGGAHAHLHPVQGRAGRLQFTALPRCTPGPGAHSHGRGERRIVRELSRDTDQCLDTTEVEAIHAALERYDGLNADPPGRASCVRLGVQDHA